MAASATDGGVSSGTSREPGAGDVVAGKYRIDGLIGQGGMGKVLAGVNTLTGKRVALKWLSPDSAQKHDALVRFRREALAAGQIDHPNVIQVYDVLEESDGSTYLVMELLNGEPLSEVVGRMGGSIPVEDAVGVLIPAMRGIAAAHDFGVVHRDLKPENIFLCQDDEGHLAGVKVLDFGVSKLSNEHHENLSITSTGMVVGTPYYMSPEQVRGMKDLDVRVDVYAMGVVLYELLSGQPPFDADSYSALMVEIATGKAPPLHSLREVDPELEKIIERAMARDRDNRFPDIESFAVALEPFGPGITFRHTRPDGTARLMLGGSTPSGARKSKVSSRAATAIHGGTDPEAPGEAPPASTGVRPSVEVPAAGSPRRGKALWFGVAAAALLLLLFGAAAAMLGGDDGLEEPAAEEVAEPAPPETAEPAATGAPASRAAPAAAEGSPAGERASEEATGAEEATPEEARAAEAESAEGTTTDEAEEPAKAEPTAAERARARRERLERLRRIRAARRARREARQQAKDEEKPSGSTRRRHRAGSLSLDDF